MVAVHGNSSFVSILGLDVKRLAHSRPERGQTSLNVGSGGQVIPGFTNVDIPSDEYYGGRKMGFIACDISSENLPFDDDSVDRIYLSHVIEHLDDRGAFHFLREASRVLKPGGVLRVVTPDSEFLWKVSVLDNDFWETKTGRAKSRVVKNPRKQDFLQQVIYSPAVLRNSEKKILNRSSSDVEMYRQLDLMSEPLDTDHASPKDHRSYWTLEKLRKVSGSAFESCIRSTYQGCVDPLMSGSYFDQRGVRVSLYVDLVKARASK